MIKMVFKLIKDLGGRNKRQTVNPGNRTGPEALEVSLGSRCEGFQSKCGHSSVL